jgi:uncharacterized membrane protein YsdA (DUF1294 family)
MEQAFWHQLLTSTNIIIYLIFMNLLTFFTMWYDKHEAKTGSWRISEKGLFTLVLLGGGIGGIIGMYAFRHKTKKWYFVIGFPLIFIIEIIVSLYFMFK